MPSILSIGGGAAEGLDQVLERMLRQQQIDQQRQAQQQQITETTRHNTAAEGIQRGQLESIERDRRDREAETKRQHDLMNDNADEASVVRQIALRPIGSYATPEEHTRETKRGAPSSLYEDYQPESLGRSTEQGEEGPTPGGFKWKGTEDQQIRLKSVEKPTPTQRETVLYKGKPVDADRDPITKKVWYKGADITADAEHYEKPTPMISLAQTDTGLQTVDRRTGKASPVTGAGGETVQPKESAQILNRRDMATSIASHFDDAEQLIDEADRRGLLGPLRGRAFNEFLAGKVGSTGNKADNELLGDLRTSLSMVRTGTASLHGRSGANVGIAKELEKKMDDSFMDPAILKGALKGLKKWVVGYATKPGAKAGGAADSPPDLIYDPATDTFKKPGS